MTIIAIDFETANEERGSACSVGLAWIEDGAVTRVEERLIRPRDNRFSPFNVAIHGIRPEDVVDAPEYPDVMAEFGDDFADAWLIAHNAAFDMGVIRAASDDYGLRYPEVGYLCTLKMSQKIWTAMPSHRLNALAEAFGVEFTHHNAAEDAYACARVALAAAREVGVEDVRGVPEKIGMKAGRLFDGGYEACSCPGTGGGRRGKRPYAWMKQTGTGLP